jgi:transposase
VRGLSPAGRPRFAASPSARHHTLPAYSPELNPIEKLWDIIKDRICNRIWADLEKLQAAINAVLKDYWDHPQKVRSLVGHGAVHAQTNVSSRSVLVV